MSELNCTTIGNQDGSLTVPSETVVAGSAKAWVNFNGTGTVAIRDSFNVSSITDNGTGDYTANFTNALANANYCPVESSGTSGMGPTSVVRSLSFLSFTTTSVRVINTLSNTTAADVDYVCFAVLSN